MTDAEKSFKKVIEFYQSLPTDLINEIFSNLNANRNLRRSLSKIRSLSEQVGHLLASRMRKMFSDAAYNTIKNKIILDLYNTEYDQMIDCIRDDNKIYVAIFFFRWCYECGKDGISNDEKYFNTFVV